MEEKNRERGEQVAGGVGVGGCGEKSSVIPDEIFSAVGDVPLAVSPTGMDF